MKRAPIDLEPGRLGCPECRYPLEPRLVPVYLDGARLGAFDGMACEMCGYGVLTEKGRGDRERALKAHDRIPLPHPLGGAAMECFVCGVITSGLTRGDLSVERTMRLTPPDMPSPGVTILRANSNVVDRMA